jgi:repressor LexA
MAKQHSGHRSEILRFLAAYLDDNGYPPTYDEIKTAVGLSSKSHVNYYLQALEEEGLIERTPYTPRGLRLVDLAPATFEVRVAGSIAAGQPLALADGPGTSIELTPDIADPRKDLYALEVEGESMVDDLVADGDLLIVERQHDAARGQTAVVHLQERNEATLKRVYPEGERVRLQPAHPTMLPIDVDARQVHVQGRVVALIRQL